MSGIVVESCRRVLHRGFERWNGKVGVGRTERVVIVVQVDIRRSRRWREGVGMRRMTLLSRRAGIGGGGGGGSGLRGESEGTPGTLGADPGASSKMLLPRADGGGGGGRRGIAEPSEPASGGPGGGAECMMSIEDACDVTRMMKSPTKILSLAETGVGSAILRPLM